MAGSVNITHPYYKFGFKNRIWTESAIAQLLIEYELGKKKVENFKLSYKQLYNEISEILTKKGFAYTPAQVSLKCRMIKKAEKQPSFNYHKEIQQLCSVMDSQKEEKKKAKTLRREQAKEFKNKLHTELIETLVNMEHNDNQRHNELIQTIKNLQAFLREAYAE